MSCSEVRPHSCPDFKLFARKVLSHNVLAKMQSDFAYTHYSVIASSFVFNKFSALEHVQHVMRVIIISPL